MALSMSQSLIAKWSILVTGALLDSDFLLRAFDLVFSFYKSWQTDPRTSASTPDSSLFTAPFESHVTLSKFCLHGIKGLCSTFCFLTLQINPSTYTSLTTFQLNTRPSPPHGPTDPCKTLLSSRHLSFNCFIRDMGCILKPFLCQGLLSKTRIFHDGKGNFPFSVLAAILAIANSKSSKIPAIKLPSITIFIIASWEQFIIIKWCREAPAKGHVCGTCFRYSLPITGMNNLFSHTTKYRVGQK